MDDSINDSSSDYSSSYEFEAPYSTSTSAVIATTLAVIIFVTVFGNLCIIIFFIVDPVLRSKVSNLYILNLSCSDFLVGVFSLTLNTSWVLHGYWPYGETVCKLWVVIDFVACFESVLAIILISLDRYLLLTSEIKYMVVQTKRKTIIRCSCTWVVAILIYAPVLLSWSAITGERNIDYSDNCEIEMVDNFLYNVILLIIEFITPLMVIGYLNMSVYMNIRKRSQGLLTKVPMASQPSTAAPDQTPNNASTSHDGTSANRKNYTPEKRRLAWADGKSVNMDQNIDSTNRKQPRNPPKNPQLRSKHKKAAKTLAVLVGVFVVCWAPYYIYSILVIICEDCFTENAWEVVNYLLWCNSTINPILYALTNSRIRHDFLKLITFGRVRSNMVDVTMTNPNNT